jgi:ketosteroid isomerase-like protein
MDPFEPIRRGYHALGLGADADVRAMLDQTGPEPACWEVHRFSLRRRSRPAGEVAALALFGHLPPQFELVRVQVSSWAADERRARLVVDGHFRVRVRGTWEAVELPFSHVWSFADGRVESVHNVLAGFELRRLRAALSCAV